MNSSQFRKSEFKKLCHIIGCKTDEIIKITSNIDDYYKERIEQKTDKKTGDFKRYRDGTIKIRVIRPSRKGLKKIQKRIKNKILVPVELPDCVHGGVKRKSNISNAKPHQGKKYQFTTDIKDFYPSISSKRVYDTFISLGFSPHFSHWLTKLTTWKRELPQGAPTSSHIANLVFLKTDIKIIAFCNEHKLTYTRYIDDLTFSAPQDFKVLLNDILNIVTSDGYNLSYRKTEYAGNQTITGIKVFLNKIDAPENIKSKSRIEIESNKPVKPYTNYVKTIRKTNIKK